MVKENKKAYSFKEVLKCFNMAKKKLGRADVDLEVWLGEKMYRVVRVGQFGIIKTVTLTLTDEPECDLGASLDE